MTEKEMTTIIKKYKLRLVGDGIKATGTLTQKTISKLKAAKPKLMARLKQEEEKKIAIKAEAIAEKNMEIARQKPLKKLALVLSGSYLLDCSIQFVVELTAEEKDKYAKDFAKNTLYHTAWDTIEIDIENPENEIAKKIQSRKVSGYLSYGESAVWLISEGEKELILCGQKKEKEIREDIKAAKEEKKQAQLSAFQAEAKKTGSPVVINSYITDQCTRNSEDCSFDRATVYMKADGSTYTTYVCCH